VNASELSRLVRHRPLPGAPVVIEASEAERAALAARFGVSAIERLRASVRLADEGPAIEAEGTLAATVIQPCAISGEDFAQEIAEEIAFRFVPAAATVAEGEIELESDQLDEIEYEGELFDLGEAVAQSLGLAIDPYAVGPDADRARREAGITGDDTPSGPLADALRALRKD
jgi:hypothetical protein